jgi:hypothetical protein
MKKWTKFIKYVDSVEHFEAINYRSRSEWIKSTYYTYISFFRISFFFYILTGLLLCLLDIFFFLFFSYFSNLAFVICIYSVRVYMYVYIYIYI